MSFNPNMIRVVMAHVNRSIGVIAIGMVLIGAAYSFADDWPAFIGPHRDAICRESGLLKEWPENGPPLAWKTTGLGEGYSSVAIVGNMLFTEGHKDGKQWVMALDVSRKGMLIWQSDFGPVRDVAASRPGSRPVPTIDGDQLYTTGIAGDVVCMDVKDGRIILAKRFCQGFRRRDSKVGLCRIGAHRRALGRLHARRRKKYRRGSR